MEELEGIIGSDLSENEILKLRTFEFMMNRLRGVGSFQDFEKIIAKEFPVGSWVEYRRQIGTNIFLKRYEIIEVDIDSRVIIRPAEEVIQNRSDIFEVLLWNKANPNAQKSIPKMKGHIRSFDGKPFDVTLYLCNNEYPSNNCRSEVVNLSELNFPDLGQTRSERSLTDYIVRYQE